MSQAIPFPASCRVFKTGNRYVAETWDGRLLASTTSGGDVAINAAIANIPGATSGTHAGRVFIQRGEYTCVSGIIASNEISGRYEGVSLVGEGPGTKLIFTPASGQVLVNAIELRMQYPQLKDMMLWANGSGVKNLVAGLGPTAGTGQYNWGVVENVSFNGRWSLIPPAGANTIKTGIDPATGTDYVPDSGQNGLTLIGGRSVPISGQISGQSYFTANWKVHNCEFFAFDTGVKVRGQTADMCNHSNIHCGSCKVGFELQGVQHNLSNIRIEGGGAGNADKVGHIGIWCRDSEVSGQHGGSIHLMNNINIEIHKSGSVGIIFENDTDNCRVTNLYNSSQDGMTNFMFIDNSTTVGVNSVIDSQLDARIPYNRLKTGSVNFGLNRPGFEHGILYGNIKRQRDGVDNPFTVTAFVNGPYMSLTTAAASGSVASVFYENGSGTTDIITDQYPSMSVRFLPNSTTATRIFMGLINSVTAPVSPLSNILSGEAGMGLYYDSAVSDNWKLMHNDNTGAPTIADFPTTVWGIRTYGPNEISTGFVQTATIQYNNSNPSASVRHHGLAFDFKQSGVIPVDGTRLGFMVAIENTSGSTAKSLRLFDMDVTLVTL